MKNDINLLNTVNQSNELSQKLRYHNKMSVLSAQEKLIIFFLASCIDPHDQIFDEVVLSISDFCRLLNISLRGGNQRKLLEQALYNLRTKGFWIVSNNGKRKEVGCWLSKGAIDYESDTVTLQLDNILRPFFLNLSNTARTIFQLGYAVKFKKKHTCDLYALCKSAVGLKRWVMPYSELRGMLGGGYNRYCDLKKRVLVPCLKEINEYSDIYVEVKSIKKGKEIYAVAFYIRNKTKQEKQDMGLEWIKFANEPLDDRITDPSVFSNYDEDDIRRIEAQECNLKWAIQAKIN